jgi:hypothetical protein
MKNIIIAITLIFILTIDVFSQEKSLFISYSLINPNYKFLPVYDNYTHQITEHMYSNNYNYSMNIGLMKYKKINYGLFINYSSLSYRLNYNFITYEYDPYLLKYSIIYSRYVGVGLIGGKNLVNKKTFKINTNIYFENNFLIQNINKHIFENNEYTYSKDILFEQKVKKYMPSIGINFEIKKKIFKNVYISVNPSVLYYFKKISDVSIEKNNIKYSLAIQLGYEI